MGKGSKKGPGGPNRKKKGAKDKDIPEFVSAFSSDEEEVVEVDEELPTTSPSVEETGSPNGQNVPDEEEEAIIDVVSQSASSEVSDAVELIKMLRTDGSSARTRVYDGKKASATTENNQEEEDESPEVSSSSTVALPTSSTKGNSKGQRQRSIQQQEDDDNCLSNNGSVALRSDQPERSQVARKRTGCIYRKGKDSRGVVSKAPPPTATRFGLSRNNNKIRNKTLQAKQSKEKDKTNKGSNSNKQQQQHLDSQDFSTSSVYTPPPSPNCRNDESKSKNSTITGPTTLQTVQQQEPAKQKKSKVKQRPVVTLDQLAAALASVGQLSSSEQMMPPTVTVQSSTIPPPAAAGEANEPVAGPSRTQHMPISRVQMEEAILLSRGAGSGATTSSQPESSSARRLRQRRARRLASNRNRSRGDINDIACTGNNADGQQLQNDDEHELQEHVPALNESRNRPSHFVRNIPVAAIQAIERDVENEIPPLFFQRLLREVLHQFPRPTGGTYDIEIRAISMLREYVQARMVEMFENGNYCMTHANRVTLMVRDLRLVQQIQQGTPFNPPTKPRKPRKISSSSESETQEDQGNGSNERSSGGLQSKKKPAEKPHKPRKISSSSESESQDQGDRNEEDSPGKEDDSSSKQRHQKKKEPPK